VSIKPEKTESSGLFMISFIGAYQTVAAGAETKLDNS
jgi:hypothetical protein